MEEKKKYYSRFEIAELLNVHPDTIRNYYTKEDLPIAFKVGIHPRFDLEEVLEWFKKRSKENK